MLPLRFTAALPPTRRKGTVKRSLKHDRIPPELAKTFHSRALQLAAGGLGPARIARELSAAYSLNVTPETIRHWVVGDRNPLFRNTFKMEPSRALSYIIGSNIGDGCTLDNNWCVKLAVADLDFAKVYNDCMATLFSRSRPNKIIVQRFNVRRRPLYVVKYGSEQLVKLLRQPLNKLLELAFEFPREFLRGFFDAEGHVDVAARTTYNFYVGADNSNRALLMRIRDLLVSAFSIEAKISRKRKSGTIKRIRGASFKMRRTSYSLLIRRLEDVKTFERDIGFAIRRKQSKLEDALMVFRNYGRSRGVAAWNSLCFKEGGEWMRRRIPRSPPEGIK